jgi:NUMOD3 motif
MTNTFLTSTRDLLRMTKPRMPKTYQLMSLIDACQAHVEIGLDTDQELIRKNGKPLTIKEIERRRKISESKKGTIPWNKGRRHSEGLFLPSCFVIMLNYCCTVPIYT